MKNIWLLTKINMKRNRLGLALSIICGILLCVMLNMFGNMTAQIGDKVIAVGVIDYDNSSLSQDFKDYLVNELKYQIIEQETFEELSTKLIERRISIIIEIPQGIQAGYARGNQENVIVTSLDDYENAAYMKVYINNYFNNIDMLSKAAKGEEQTFLNLLKEYHNTTIKVTQTAAVTVDQEAEAGKFGFISAIGFFLMIIFVISIVFDFMILDDRLKGLYNRVQIAPVKPLHYILGTGLFGLILCFLMVFIFCGYVYFSDSITGVPFSTLIIIMSLFSIFTVCFSLAVAVVLISKNAMTSIVIGFSTIGCILGGAYFPIDMAPKAMQNLSRILPQYWFMDAFRTLQLDVHANINYHIIILSLFTLLFLLLGAVSYARHYKSS
ncbi:MAG: ABC transporter permease [Mobilitalea sp.]